ncbi:dnk [Lepeophtheirus salmonis]|uniref:Dnk n=1 Tax=Lepeophtheirus salmonis TaxID=72036 RepID=A0A7R8CRT7_LEPSM|nr:dnk [Lepeophtheirus salmonis]CAF2910273.1 dnk [Lepeophtheirus salmonis]
MLKFFQSKDVIIDPEPVDSWRNVAGENLLNNMYKDPPRCSFTFQSYVQLTRLKLLEEHGNEKVKIIERSIQSNNFVFLETAKKRKTLSDVELEVLGSYHSWIQNHTISKHLDLIVYLRTLPEVAYCRLQKRARAEERTVPLDYLQDLHDAYEDWLMKKDMVKSTKHKYSLWRTNSNLGLKNSPHILRWHLQNRLPELLYRDFITSLPLEIAERIFTYLDCKSLLAGSCVSHGWNRRISDSFSIWRQLAEDLCGISSHTQSYSKDYWKKMTVLGYRFRSMMKEGKCFVHKSESDLLLSSPKLSCEACRKIITLHYDQEYIAMGAIGTPRNYKSIELPNSKCILVWSIQNSEITHAFPISLGISIIKLFWPKYVVYGTFDGRIETRNLENKDLVPLRFTEQHTSAILTIDGHLKHDILVSGSSDFRVKVWKLSTGELVNIFSHWIDSVLFVPKEKHSLISSSGRDLIITMTRDAIQIFDTDYSSVGVSFNLIGGNQIAFIRQLPMFDTHTIGDVDILIIDAENGNLVNSVHINKKYNNLAIVDLKTSEIAGGCTVPHSHATTPDFAQITVGSSQWLDGLLPDELMSKNNLILSLSINEGVMHNVYWDHINQ